MNTILAWVEFLTCVRQSPLLCEASLALLEWITLLLCSCSLRGALVAPGSRDGLQAYDWEARGLGNDQPL